MDLNPSPVFRRRPAASSANGITEVAKSPPPSSPSSSRSSPFSSPSSPSSTYSSPGATATDYHGDAKGNRKEGTGHMVSSTSLVPPKSASSAPLQEIYDPFHPTEGEREGRGAEQEEEDEEEEGEKYDPFDPTGSPASDEGESTMMEEEEREEVGGAHRRAEPERVVEMMTDQDKAKPPPDSTAAPPRNAPALRRRPGCQRGKARDRRASGDSEIEEGEIVVAPERGEGACRRAGLLPLPGSPLLHGAMPERILRILDADGFVSVRADPDWPVDVDPALQPVVGLGDLRRKLVSRRKERYRSCPALSSSSPPPLPLLPPASPLPASEECSSRSLRSSDGSKEQDRPKCKDVKVVEERKEERKKRRKKDKEGSRDRSERGRERRHKAAVGEEDKGARRRRSSSRRRRKRRDSSPRSHRLSAPGKHSRRSLSSPSMEWQWVRGREGGADRDRDGKRSAERRRDRERAAASSRRQRERSSSWERDRRSRRSRERREQEAERRHDRGHKRRRDGRPVVPPSIQDLNGSDLFAIKRTITVTTTTTTTTVPSSPALAPPSPRSPAADTAEPHKRKRKRKRHEEEAEEDVGRYRGRSRSLSVPKYHGYSDRPEADMLSLDGEALDSDYPSLEDTPPAALVPDPLASPEAPTTPLRHHPKKKSQLLKRSSSAGPTKSKGSFSLLPTSAPPISVPVSSARRARKLAKEKERDKSGRKQSGRSAKVNESGGGSRKGKLQSKVSVLVREGVSSTTGASAGPRKRGMELLGAGSPGGAAGGPGVGGSIAVVFRRDNESRSPFLKPCSEPLALSGRSKDQGKMGKRSALAAAPPSGLKAKVAKPSSTTSTSSSASSSSSSSSSLATKTCRRLGKKAREKCGAGPLAVAGSQSQASAEGWARASSDAHVGAAAGSKSVSPQAAPTGPVAASSSLCSTSVLPPPFSPPPTPPHHTAPLRDTRESSPDSQTVDSSCKTPEALNLVDDGPAAATPGQPPLSPPSPPSLPAPQGAVHGSSACDGGSKLFLPDDGPKASPPCSSSSSGSAHVSLSLPPSSSDPSSSSSSVSSSSAGKPPPPPPPLPTVPTLPWSLQAGVDCTAGGVLALTALLFKMEEANIASRAKAQEFIQATSQILTQANQSQSQQYAPSSSTSSSSSFQIPPPPSLPPPPGPSPAQFILHGSLPLVGSTKTPPSHLHTGMSMGSGCAQTPPPPLSMGFSGMNATSGEVGWDSESKDPDKYLKKLHTQERAVEEVKLAIKPYYQRKDINKDEYKDILRKAVHKICHSRTGEINPVKVSNLVKLYVQRYKYFRKHGRKMDDEEREEHEQGILHFST